MCTICSSCAVVYGSANKVLSIRVFFTIFLKVPCKVCKVNYFDILLMRFKIIERSRPAKCAVKFGIKIACIMSRINLRTTL